MFYVEKNTFTDAYVSALKNLMENGREKSPRGLKVKYFQNFLFSVENPGDVFHCDSRPYRWDYLNKELSLYFKGERSSDKFAEASKFWKHLENPDGTINSNYGYLVFYKPIVTDFTSDDDKNMTQWKYAKQQLISDKDTRQALMFISSPHVQFKGNKDFICTLNYTFSINEDVLSLEVNRRSQDAILGIVYDYAWEWLLLVKMYNELLEYYPTLKIGSYTMFCNNFHVYEKNFELVKNMIDDYENSRYMEYNILGNIDREIETSYVFNKEF